MSRQRKSTVSPASLSRRSVLRITGGAAVAATLGPRAFAQTTAKPKRLIIVFSPDGTIQSRWRPTGSQTNFTLGTILSPLQAHKSDMIVVDGAKRITTGVGDGHQQGMTQILTGRANLSGATKSTGPSIDEFVNLRIGEGRPALRLGVLSRTSATNWTRMTFGENGSVLHPQNSPYIARDTILSGVSGGMTGTGTPTDPRRQAIRNAVLGYSKNRAAALATAVGDLSRPDVQTHLQSLDSLLKEPAPSLMPAAQCSMATVNAWEANLSVTANDNFPKLAKMQAELISAAFACDRARVAVLQCAMSNSEVYWKWVPGGGPASEHHGLSHYEFGNADPARSNILTEVYKWHAQLISNLVTDLKAKGLFDNTVVLWTSEMGEGQNHSSVNIPMVILGSGGGYFKTGQWMNYRASGGVSHCDVLTSVCQSMGIDIAKFGDPTKGSGPLKGVT